MAELTVHALEAVRVAVHEGMPLSWVYMHGGMAACCFDLAHVLLDLLQADDWSLCFTEHHVWHNATTDLKHAMLWEGIHCSGYVEWTRRLHKLQLRLLPSVWLRPSLPLLCFYSGEAVDILTFAGKNLSSLPTCASRGTLMLSGCKVGEIQSLLSDQQCMSLCDSLKDGQSMRGHVNEPAHGLLGREDTPPYLL